MSDLKDLREREDENLHEQNLQSKQSNKYPTHLRVLGILGAILFVAGLVILILGLMKKVPGMGADNWFDSQSAKMFTCFGGGVMIMCGLALSIMALMPLIAKLNIKTTKYIAKDNKNDFKDIADTSGDIIGGVTKNIARQNAEALKEVNASNNNAASAENASAQKALYCEKCGQPISPTANYCKFCRAKINK